MMTTKPKIKLDLVGIQHHVHLVNRILKAAREAGMPNGIVDELDRRLRKNAEPLTTGQVLAIVGDLCEIE